MGRRTQVPLKEYFATVKMLVTRMERWK